MMRVTRGREAGFALIESIAVLALGALVLLALVVATDIVSRSSAVAARRASDLETLTTGLAAVRRDLEGALFVRSSLEPEAAVVFSGASDSVGLVVGSDRSGRGGGESLIVIEARYGGHTGALVRSSAQFLPGMSGFASAEFAASTVLAEGPWQYRFSYADVSGEEVKWRSSWKRSTKLPVAVRLEVLNSRGQRVVPSLTAPVHINSDGCSAEDETRCRGGGSP
jgi:general secretion pathway protein J